MSPFIFALVAAICCALLAGFFWNGDHPATAALYFALAMVSGAIVVWACRDRT